MNGIENRIAISRKPQADIYKTNPIGVARKQFNKFIKQDRSSPRKELLKNLDLEMTLELREKFS